MLQDSLTTMANIFWAFIGKDKQMNFWIQQGEGSRYYEYVGDQIYPSTGMEAGLSAGL